MMIDKRECKNERVRLDDTESGGEWNERGTLPSQPMVDMTIGAYKLLSKAPR